MNKPQINHNKIRKLKSIIDKIPQFWKDCIKSSAATCTVESPRPVVNFKDNDCFVCLFDSNQLYRILTSNLLKIPTGVVRWRADLLLSEQQLKTALTFTKICSSSVFDKVFQYKIVTQILPTNKYLHRYQIKESELCSRCLLCADTIYHNLWQCSRLTPYLTACFDFLTVECNLVDIINAENFLFGFIGSKREGINHVLLELKKHVFYNWNCCLL